jgi:hypothetical protein
LRFAARLYTFCGWKLAHTKGQWKRKKKITLIDILAMLGVEAWSISLPSQIPQCEGKNVKRNGHQNRKTKNISVSTHISLARVSEQLGFSDIKKKKN